MIFQLKKIFVIFNVFLKKKKKEMKFFFKLNTKWIMDKYREKIKRVLNNNKIYNTLHLTIPSDEIQHIQLSGCVNTEKCMEKNFDYWKISFISTLLYVS